MCEKASAGLTDARQTHALVGIAVLQGISDWYKYIATVDLYRHVSTRVIRIRRQDLAQAHRGPDDGNSESGSSKKLLMRATHWLE